jgi:hypothetical protein
MMGTLDVSRLSMQKGSDMPPAERFGPSRGTLLLADISGYTAFFHAVGEAHGAEMAAGTFVPEAYPLLTSLLDGIVDRIVPPFSLSKLEGDAVFAFARDGELQPLGTSLVDRLRSCYEWFRGQVNEARDLMPCMCNACSSIATLQLKFVIHHGDYVVTSIAGREELLGPSVTLAHLLLKNRVAELIGRVPYALFTDEAATHLGIPVDGARAITEEYDHYPMTQGFVLTFS